MSDINYFSLDDLKENGKLYRIFLDLLSKKMVVPMIGSGFTAGCKARSGVVPNVTELCEFIASLIMRCAINISDNDRDDIEKAKADNNLRELFELLNSIDEKDDRNPKWRELFRDYMTNHFTEVHDLNSSQKAFLDIDWDYLYTLNYDDAIEWYYHCSQSRFILDVAIPYKRFDREWLIANNHRCLIKPHGDVHEFIRTNEINSLVISNDQYARLIGDNLNKMMTDGLEQDFCSKSILFIGCGLNNEYDLAFTSRQGLNAISALAQEFSYYVYYDKESSETLPLRMKAQLDSFGIKNVIIVPSKKMNQFYSLFAAIAREAKRVNSKSALSRYTNHGFIRLKADDSKNKHFLYSNSGLIDDERHIINLPYFAIHRSVEAVIKKKLDSGYPITILLGNRFSGKTYALLGVYETLASEAKHVFFFSGIGFSARLFPQLFKQKDSIVIFDSGTLDPQCFRDNILSNIKSLIHNHIQLVVAVNSSDEETIEHLARSKGAAKNLARVDIAERFNETELKDFNSRIGRLLLINRKINESFYDYLIRLDEAEAQTTGNYYFRNINIFKSDDTPLLAAVITLALKPAFDTSFAIKLNIINSVNKLCIQTNGIIQPNYIGLLQRTNHSGIYFLSNSTYWLRRCLSVFAEDKSNYENIAEAYEFIIRHLLIERGRSFSASRDYEFHQSIEPFVSLDLMQEIFFIGTGIGGSIQLPKIVFDRLSKMLPDEYQFLHQYSKCLYRFSDRLSGQAEDRIKHLSRAKMIVERAIGLAEASNGIHKDESIAHMAVTRSNIMCKIIMVLNEEGKQIQLPQLKKAIKAYEDVYITYADSLQEHIAKERDKDREKGRGKGKGSLSGWFFSNLLSSWSETLKGDSSLKEEANALLEAVYPGKSFHIF